MSTVNENQNINLMHSMEWELQSSYVVKSNPSHLLGFHIIHIPVNSVSIPSILILIPEPFSFSFPIHIPILNLNPNGLIECVV